MDAHALEPGAGRRLHRAVALVAIAVVLLLGAAATPGFAHTELVSSEPDDGAVLARAPGRVELRFSEAVQEPAYVVVTGPDGTTLFDGEGAVDGATVTQELDATARGSYRLGYRVVSGDGHPETGEVTWSVGRERVRAPRGIRGRRGGSILGWAAVGALAATAVVIAVRRRPR